MFFTYSQNNSGGVWALDMPRYLVVEAPSRHEADRRAESAGVYFDGCDNHMDCPCCGDRWCRTYEDGDAVPSIYGQPAAEYAASADGKRWAHLCVRIVYADGRTEEA